MAELTAREQLMLEMVNRARLDPGAEAASLGIGINTGLSSGQISSAAKQPLAANELIKDAALAHSQWMIAQDVFSHTGSGGSGPGDRMSSAGYNFTGSWTWGENIAWSGSTGSADGDAYTVELANNLFLSPHHRENILNDAFRELGTGISTGQFTAGGTTYNAVMATQDFATSGSDVFLTGVAIQDADGDNFYDIGEARSGISVAVSVGGAASGSDTTATAGGYAVGFSGGMASVTFSGGGLTSDVSATIMMGARNAKIDLINDHEIASSASVTLGNGAFDLVLLGIASINGTGNADPNHVLGNRGNNVLSGGAGNDVLTGGQGRDVLAGGAGRDLFDFNSKVDSGKTSSTRDYIADFVHGSDRIDLAGIDSRLDRSGNQAFAWMGTSKFSGRDGQLRYEKVDKAGSAHDTTIIYGDINGDKKPDFHIVLDGLHTLSRGDFIL